MCSPISVMISGSSTFKGVTCIDLNSDEMFKDLVSYHQGGLAYGFVMSLDQWVMAHPLLSRPLGAENKVVLLQIADAEQQKYHEYWDHVLGLVENDSEFRLRHISLTLCHFAGTCIHVDIYVLRYDEDPRAILMSKN